MHQILRKQICRPLMFLLLLMFLIAQTTLCAFAAAGSQEPIEGILVSWDGNGSGSGDTTITITAKGSLLSKKTTKVTIKNNSNSTATIAFDYTISSANSHTFSGESGTWRENLDAGETQEFSITSNSGFSNLTVTLKLENFSYTAVSAEATATVTYDNTKGSVSLGGAAVANGGSATATNGELAAVATPKSGYTFVGWVNTDTAERMSPSASATLNVPQDVNVQAIFVKSDGSDDAWFLTGNYLYDNFSDAAAKAQTLSSKVFLPVYDGTLPAGDYTIPAGVTLLIPFDNDNTLITNDHKSKDALVQGGTAAAAGAFRTLTMGSGANIVVNGTICMPAQINAPGGGKTNAGSPTGQVPYIRMQGSSSITLNNGAFLYCYGFITGSGTVTVNNGATVYECFQIRDYRGGDGSTNIDHDIFPSSQYYIQNVEVPMTVEGGGTLKGVSAIYVSYVLVYMDGISIIGSSNSMFTNSGTVTKRYDGSTDRLVIDIDGDASLGSISLKLSAGIFSSAIDSVEYVLGINNNMTININSGKTTVNQSVALQPGAILNIAEDAELALSKNMYVYDAEEWGDYVYCESMTTALGGIEHPSTESMQDGNNWAAVQVAFAPGKKYTRTLADLTDARIDVNGTLTATAANIYTTSSGAEIVSSKGTGVAVITAGSETITYQADMNSSSTLDYYDIPIESAWLQNYNGTYVESTTNTYFYKDGFWHTDGTCNGTWGENETCDCAHPASSKVVGTKQHYGMLQTAVSACGSSDYVRMLANTTETISATSKVVVDLAGYTVTLNNDSSVATVSFMDKSTDGYADSNGRVIASSTVANSIPDVTSYAIGSETKRNYVKVVDTKGDYAFPRVATTLSGIGYRSNAAGSYLTYQNTLRGNTLVKDSLSDMGFLFGSASQWRRSVPDKTDQDSSTAGWTIFAHYDVAKPDTLPTSVLAQVKLDDDTNKVVTSSYPTADQLAAAFTALGLK